MNIMLRNPTRSIGLLYVTTISIIDCPFRYDVLCARFDYRGIKSYEIEAYHTTTKYFRKRKESHKRRLRSGATIVDMA